MSVISLNKYYDIYLDLVKDIKEKKYLPGDFLPVEMKLVEKYHVSRETVRKAQALLMENGLIQKKQGRGAIVLDINKLKFAGSGLVSFNEMQKQQHLKSETTILKNKRERISGELAKKLNLNKKTEVLSLERLRKINGEAVILDKDYLIAEIIPEIPLSAAQLSIYSYIENDLGLNIGYANKEITVEPVTEEDRILLDIHNDTHVAVVRSEVYLEDTRFFQYHESRQRVDTFRFVDFARRKNIVDF